MFAFFEADFARRALNLVRSRHAIATLLAHFRSFFVFMNLDSNPIHPISPAYLLTWFCSFTA
jgi:hypothetical protein